jgi:rhodanese-related sulfurtransferase
MQNPLISVKELKHLLTQTAEVELVDVRTLEKHQEFNIGGKHIFSDELPNRLYELDTNKLIVTYCTTGGRSMRALEYLRAQGFTKVRSLDGGLTAWKTDE